MHIITSLTLKRSRAVSLSTERHFLQVPVQASTVHAGTSFPRDDTDFGARNARQTESCCSDSAKQSIGNYSNSSLAALLTVPFNPHGKVRRGEVGGVEVGLGGGGGGGGRGMRVSE